MTYGISSADFQILKDFILEPLKASHAKVFIFGSRARGQHHKFSDIDLLFEEDPSSPIPLERIALFKEGLENSSITVKVDLVNSKDLAASYRAKVNAEKIQI
jgi:predicted nucleotidyltransferase